MTVVGFDFGTTNSLISVVMGERTIEIVDPEDGLPFPSVVRYEGEKTFVGRAAKQLLDSAGIGIHGNTVLSPKFLLGDESVHVGGVERSPIDIVHDVIRHVRSEALSSARAAELGDIERAVVTIPIGMNGPKRAALREAFRRAGVAIVQFVHEPLAALYGFFRSSGDMASLLREYNRRNLLVVDWGGGTLDLTLCRLEGHRLFQRRNSGSDEVGGDRFDEAIRNAVVQRFINETGIGATSDIHPDARIRLLHDSEANKIALSTRSSVTFYRQGFFRNPEATLEYRLTREALEEITSPLTRMGIGRVSELLDGAGLGPQQVSLVLLTGGMAGMPSITGRINEMFGPQRVAVSERAATLVAQGAAWIAHDQQRLNLAKSVELRLARGSYLPLIPAGTQMPVEREVQQTGYSLYSADPRDGSAKFELCTPSRVGSDTQTSDPRTVLGNLVLRVDPRAEPFRERLELQLSIDEDLILRARAASAGVRDETEAAFHDLEFGISMPSAGPVGGHHSGIEDPETEGILSTPEGHEAERGALVTRANVADSIDDYLVPGELLYTYKPNYFDRRLDPPQIQVEERLFYEPCAVCGRSWSDPNCRCGHQR